MTNGHFALVLLLRLGTWLIDMLPFVAVIASMQQLWQLLESHSNHEQVAPSPSNLTNLLFLYCHVETAFLVYFYFEHKRLQKPVAPPPIAESERGKTFFRILDHSDGDFREYFAGWFYWADSKRQVSPDEFHLIRRDNFRDWFSWMLYGARSYNDLLRDPKMQPFVAELNNFVLDFELSKNIILQPGRNTDMEPVILNYNSVDASPRPLLFYAAVNAAETAAFAFLYSMGFRRSSLLKQEGNWVDATNGINYWAFHPTGNKNSKGMPIVFFHGIGCGLFPYALLIRQMMLHSSTSSIFLVESPHVAMQLCSHVPSMEQTVFEVETMLDVHGVSKALVVGHSLGSASAAWMIKHSKYCASSVLLDPIVFTTFHPSLAFNFVHRNPGHNTETTKANEFMTRWLCSRELYISHTISRHFIWHQAMIWAEDLPKNHHVVVSRQDLLIDVCQVEKYLVDSKVNYTAYDLDHGEFLFTPHVQQEVVAKIADMAREIHA
ncbi:hypothetical protein HDU98_004947 [Podochytrium sp. JEL0797]|nr:hypothetical protein HDU98_004947 [Podochytrium sp. JEL0797]